MTSSCRFPFVSRLLFALLIVLGVSLPASVSRAEGQASNASQNRAPGAASTAPQSRMRGTTNAQRRAAAAHSAVRRATARRGLRSLAAGVHTNAVVGAPGAGSGTLLSLDQLYFSGVYPNYANSPLPNTADTVNCAAPNWCGLRKFVDTLPLLNQANNLGMSLPVAVPDTVTFPNSDYYEISLVEYHQQMHSDLPKTGTQLRGYVQTNYGTDSTGHNTIAPQPVSYLGPIIVAHSNRAVRVKFINALNSASNGGNLFLPVDTSVLGSGLGLAKGAAPYLQNRATVHLHGGNTPWISDGTPHQWTVPASDWNNTPYVRGDSVAFVPDMFFVNGVVVPQCGAVINGTALKANCSDPTGASNAQTLPAGATNDPGPGALTFYYTNQQSARLLFYHDHSYGTTRLNVYAGEAGGYVIRDNVEADLASGTNASGVFTSAGIAPGRVLPTGDAEIPLVIQDKSYVPQNPASTTVYSVPLLEPGEGYTTATVNFSGGCTTEPTATASVGTLIDPFGQSIDGAITGITLNSAGSGCTSGPIVTITGNGTGAVAFASIATLSQQDPTWDSALWGGYGNLWYPHVYMTNQWPGNPDGSGINPMGRWDYASWFWPPFNGQPSQYTVRGEVPCPTTDDPTMTCPGFPSPLTPAPSKEVNGDLHQGVGSTVSLTPEGFMDTPTVNGTAYPTLTVDPKPYRFRVLSVANERTFNLSWFLACDSTGNAPQYAKTAGASCPAPSVAGIPNYTEVGMVPAVSTTGFPPQWPTDGRAGGVPDPAAMGPSWVQIANEGGVLPLPAVIPPSPVVYETNLRSVTVTNIQSHGLLLMSAERADAIVDFTPYAGKTLILYNDGPAPTPAYDTRLDYYTGDPDQTSEGGAPSTLAGFGPNTRTIMQVYVRQSLAGPAQPAVDMTKLNALIPAAFRLTQPVPVVPEPTYSKVYGQTFKAAYPTLKSSTLTFTPLNPVTEKLAAAPVTLNIGFKTIQELFDLDYGRMNATLGTELPLTNYNTQTTIPLGFTDPFTETLYDSANVSAMPVGVANDGTQIWMVVHNGVDSHAIHFHLYNVQLINRYGWDGTNRPPFPDELGWKDTVRMNPLEIDFVALRPVSQTLPFPVPDSQRLFDVTKPAGAGDGSMSNVNPLGNAAPQLNQTQPMGWEYVWHCHLLGHEENDMMREQVFQVPPQTPQNLTATALASGYTLNFTDMSLSEAGFNVQRADDANFSVNVATLQAPSQAGWNTAVSYVDKSATPGHNYYYRVQAFKPDADYWNTQYGNPALAELTSGWSNAVHITAAAWLQVAPSSLAFGTLPYKQASAPMTVTLSNIGTLPLTLNSIGIVAGATPAGFSITTNTCKTPNAVLAAGATCYVSIVLGTNYPGQDAAKLVINSTDANNPVFNVPLTGAVPALPSGYLDSAVNATNSTTVLNPLDTLLVKGWAADFLQGAPVSSVQVLIDGVAVNGTLSMGLPRTDVATSFKNPAWLNSGFSFSYPARLLTAGTHTVTAIAANSLGLTLQMRTLTITRTGTQAPIGALESVSDALTGGPIYINPLDGLVVSGWAADFQDNTPVARVSILIDGTANMNATVGLSRPDIATLYNAPLFTNAGWRAVVDASKLTSGWHTVAAVAYDSLGLSTRFATVKSVFVYAKQPTPLGGVTSAADAITNTSNVSRADNLVVGGWAADPVQGSPISKVQITIDGVVVGNATLGLASPAIATTYNNPKYGNAGWTFTMPASGLSVGLHQVGGIAVNQFNLQTVLPPKAIAVK